MLKLEHVGVHTHTSLLPRLTARRTRVRRVLTRCQHFVERREAAQRLELDLTHSLAREAELPADRLERLGLLGPVEAVAEDDHLPLARRQRVQHLAHGVAAERDLDLLLGRGLVPRDEVAEDGVLLLADRLV